MERKDAEGATPCVATECADVYTIIGVALCIESCHIVCKGAPNINLHTGCFCTCLESRMLRCFVTGFLVVVVITVRSLIRMLSYVQRKPRATIRKGRKPVAKRPSASRAVVSHPPASLRDFQTFDTAQVVGTNAGGWVYTSIFQPTQGSTSTSRYGDKTLSKSLNVFINVTSGKTLPFRIIFYYDSQPNGANPTSPAPMAILDPSSFKDPDLRERFQILRDFWITNAGTAGVANVSYKETNFCRAYVKLNHITQFKSNAGTIADVQSGAFGFCIYNGATEASAVNIQTRIIFQS